jgi:hypothetical protein
MGSRFFHALHRGFDLAVEYTLDAIIGLFL